MTTITASAAGGTRAWSDTASWVGGVAPTSADDVLLTVTSGAITIDGAAGTESKCRSLVCTGYTNTLTHGAAKVLQVGDGTAGAFTIVSGMTYTPNATAVINFVSTTTGNNLTFGGKTLPVVTFNGAGGAWTFLSTFTNGARLLTITAGTLDTNGQTCTFGDFNSNNTNTRALTLGATALTVSADWNITDGTNMTITANTSTISFTASSVNFNGGGMTYNNVTFTGGGANNRISQSNTFNILTFTGTAVKTDMLRLGATQTATTAVISGNSVINRVLLCTDIIGTTRTLSAGTFTFSNLDLRDIIKAGAGSGNISAITGLSGDCGGNTGWTFTTPINTYWVASGGTSTGSFSAVTRWASASGGTAGTGRAPLPQDTSIFNASSIDAGSRTITQDMVRIGSVNWTGVTNTPAWTKTTACEFYGSFTLVSGMTQSGAQTYTCCGRGANTFTSGAITWTNGLNITCASGSITQQDDLVSSSTFAIISGTYDTGVRNATFTTFQMNGSTVATADGVFNLGGTLTLSGAFTTASTSLGTFNGSGQTVTGGTTASISAGTIAVGNWVLSSTYTQTAGGTVTLGSGGLSCTSVSLSGTATRSLSLGSGTITLSGTGTIWASATSTGLTFDAQTSTIDITNTSASTKTFSGGTLTYNNMRVRGAASAGVVGFAGTPAFNELRFDPDANIQFVAGNAYTATTLNWIGTSGHLITISTNSAGVASTMVVASGTVSCNYINLKDNTASGSTPFYAGANSTDSTGNTNWIFTAPPTPGNGAVYLGSTKINQIYLGSTQLKRAYYGTTLVFKDT